MSSARKMYEEKYDFEILKTLGCSENPEFILIYLQNIIPTLEVFILESYESDINFEARKKDVDAVLVNIFLSTLAKHANKMSKQILKNYRELKYRYNNIYYLIYKNILYIIMKKCVLYILNLNLYLYCFIFIEDKSVYP